jgi:hypothetical protein
MIIVHLVNETYLLKSTNYERDRQIKFQEILLLKFKAMILLNDKTAKSKLKE